jgi:hypothetical protein
MRLRCASLQQRARSLLLFALALVLPAADALLLDLVAGALAPVLLSAAAFRSAAPRHRRARSGAPLPMP